MANLADQIRNERTEEFIKEFDTEVFDAFVVDEIKRRGYAHIGLVHDSLFNGDYLRNKKQVRESNYKLLTFAEWYKCYIWDTNCQIPQKFSDAVEIHLRNEGFNITYRGACGYDEWDIMVVTL